MFYTQTGAQGVKKLKWSSGYHVINSLFVRCTPPIPSLSSFHAHVVYAQKASVLSQSTFMDPDPAEEELSKLLQSENGCQYTDLSDGTIETQMFKEHAVSL